MGIFGTDHESAGVGIPKDAPKKKGIARFFELFFRKFWKLIQVNMLYSAAYIPLVFALYAFFKVSDRTVAGIMIVFCIAVFAVVIGPATTGMMKILRNYFLEKHAFILTDFKDAFSKNFKKSFAMGLIDILAFTAVGSSVYVYPQLAKAYGQAFMTFFVLSASVGLVVMMMNFYTFLMIAGTDLSFKNILRNSFVLSLTALKKNLLTLFISLLIAGVFVVLTLLNMSTIMFLPFVPASIIAFIICFNSYPVIQKYIIIPYYEQKGEINPELDAPEPKDDEEVLFEDKGGSEKPIEKKKKKVNEKSVKSTSRGKIIS